MSYNVLIPKNIVALASMLIVCLVAHGISEVSARHVHDHRTRQTRPLEVENVDPVEPERTESIHSTIARPAAPVKYFWHPKDDKSGGFVPAITDPIDTTKKKLLGDERDVHFYLFTPSNPTTLQELFTNDLGSVDSSNFNRNAPVKFVAHGFSSSSEGGSAGALRDAYLSKYSEINVILIDWRKLAAAPMYNEAAANTRLVGAVSARFIEFLIDHGRTTLDKIDLAGHSLGAHICGFIGAGLLVGKPPRIIALDPALPLFGGVSDEGRIDPTDARFVQVIHTSGGPLTSGELAFMDPRGHADFYPNGGKNQPGCSGLPEVVGACSHSRSYEFFAESIRTDRFTSCKCTTWEHFNSCNCGDTAKMGEYTASSTRGFYHVTTNGSPPYAQG